MDTTKIQSITEDYFENVYFNKLQNLKDMGKFLDTYDLPKTKCYVKSKLINNKLWDGSNNKKPPKKVKP